MHYSLKNISFLFLLSIIPTCLAFAQFNKYPHVRTPQNITVNHKLPKNILTPNEPMTASFSKKPTDAEIFSVHCFEEPLIPTDQRVSSEENSALVYTLATYSQRKSPDDFSCITNFLNAYPKSRWRGALMANLGIVYRRSGYYNKALDAWQQAWYLMKEQSEPKIKILADRVISELLLINAWVGRFEDLEMLLNSIKNRVIEGPATERITSAKEGLWTMKYKTGIAFKCGPYALNRLFVLKDSSHQSNKKLMEVQSPKRGFSLFELEKMAEDIGLNYQMAFRNPGAEVITNSVVHWKLNHYSALIKMDSIFYKCEDATMGTVYGQQFWLTPSALDSSASGYFLVPPGALPKGWRKVNTDEGSKIFGKGAEPAVKGKHVSDCDQQLPGGCGGGKPMAQSNVHAAAVSLHIFDQPVYYTPPKGPFIAWDVEYHHRDTYQPSNFNYSNMGPKWTFRWLSYIQDDPNNPAANADVYLKGGGVNTFVAYNSSIASYAPELQSKDILVRICPTCYELRHPDGSREVYARPDGGTTTGRKIFLTETIDIAGNKVTVLYDGNLRISGLKDALGQVTTIKYENTSDIYKITKVIDPFGRSASFDYENGKLVKITDMIGIVSSFKYETGDFINQMTTPYGTTSFVTSESPDQYFRSLETTYPLGEKERLEYRNDGIASGESLYPAGMPLIEPCCRLLYRNTFFWDKKAMKEAPGDYNKAQVYHWLHGSGETNDELNIAAPILESIKKPLERRIWFNYQNQTGYTNANAGMSSQPAFIGRVLDDGTTQLTKFTYNQLGAVTSSTDPLGRTMAYKYDQNNIDLLEVRQIIKGDSQLLAKYSYNNQHLPLTAMDVSGQKTIFTYNIAGQLETVTNPRKEKTTFFHNPTGYLDSIAGPIAGAKVSFSYDAFGRIRSVTDAEGYTITTDYDALDRPTLITYPDKTFEQIVYDRLDAVATRDRLSRWSHLLYDSLDRLNAVTDALGKITQFIWCSCGSLAEIIDPLKHITQFTRDLQGRVTSKIYDDEKVITYKYENTTSRLKEVTDAKGQATQYDYYIDNNLKQVSYRNTSIATGSVAFTYDSGYNRVKTMKDTTGVTAYSYNPVTAGQSGAGSLAKIDGPLPNDDITYLYDSLGRINNRSVQGVASSVIYDALGRVTSTNNVLGNFIYKYINQTNRLSSVNYPNGQSTAFTYYDNLGDQRLKEIWNKTGNNTLSKFNYEYNTEGQITKWIQQAGTATPKYYELGYDLTDQLISATQKNQSTNAVVKRYAYQYDKAGNRTSEQIDNSVTSAAYNTLNQMTKQQDNGPIHFKGNLNKFSSVMIKNLLTSDSAVAAVDSLTNSFESFVNTKTGANNLVISAIDFSGKKNRKDTVFNLSVAPGINSTLAYDKNGNTDSVSNPKVKYGWDVADRLVKIKQGNNTTEFVYDGLSRRVAEKLNGTVIKRWLWCGTELCEERSSGGGTVTKRFFPQGEQIGGINYYFTRDHLGSIREMTDASGAIKTRYDYDPYGRRTLVFGTDMSDFGFSGHYFHKASDLNLALYRAYNANLGRWLKRDPMQENAGSNLYSYVRNNPLNSIDFLGLWGTIPGFTIHQNYIDQKLSSLSSQDRDILKNAQVAIDEDQSSAGAYKHAMRGPGETKCEAANKADKFIKLNMKLARDLEARGFHEDALTYLGYAMHTAQDATSPAHEGFQLWDENFTWINEGAHIMQESAEFQAEHSDLGNATSEMYDYFTGKKAMPEKFFNCNGTRNF